MPRRAPKTIRLGLKIGPRGDLLSPEDKPLSSVRALQPRWLGSSSRVVALGQNRPRSAQICPLEA